MTLPTVRRRRICGRVAATTPRRLTCPSRVLLVHAAGEGANGFCVFDVFESEDAVEAFRSALGSIPEDAGIAEPPRFFPAHTVYIA